jgi:hypothetical protein
MPTGVEIPNLVPIQESTTSDPAGDDEEMAHPPALAKGIGSVECALPTVIEGQQQVPAG